MSRKAYLLLVIATMATCMVTVFFAGKLPARVVVNIHQTIGMNLLHSSDQSIDMDDHRLDRDIDIDSRHSDQDIDMDDHRLDQDIDMDDYRSDQDIDMDDYRSDQDIDIYMDLNYSYTDHRHRISLESTMPFPKETKPAEEILRQNWTNQIQDFLRNCSRSSPVTVVAANYPYRDVVINWLIAARVKVEPPLENILVVSFDSPLQELLQRVGIESVQVPPESVLINSAYVNAYDKLLVARVIVLRLINYWGYDVAHYDTDAIILKNPLSLYNKHADSDVVGSTGTWPFELGKKWGFTLCMGVILFRSTPQTGLCSLDSMCMCVWKFHSFVCCYQGFSSTFLGLIAVAVVCVTYYTTKMKGCFNSYYTVISRSNCSCDLEMDLTTMECAHN